MRPNEGALPADWFVALLTEILEGMTVKGTVFILVVHIQFLIKFINDKGRV